MTVKYDDTEQYRNVNSFNEAYFDPGYMLLQDCILAYVLFIFYTFYK